jgi:hypothetical protein
VAEDETPSEVTRTDGRRHWPTVTAVAAAVAVLAATLYGGSQLFDGESQAAADPAPLRLDAYGDGPEVAADAAGSSALGYAGSGIFYRASGELPAAGEDAPLYEFSGSVGEAEVAALAEALGVAGTPEQHDGRWEVGAGLPQGELSLSVTTEAPGEWYLTPYRIDMIDPQEPAIEPAPEPGGPDIGLPEPEPGGDRAGPGMPPMDDQDGGGVPGKPAPDPGSEVTSIEEVPKGEEAESETSDVALPVEDAVSEKEALAVAGPVAERLGLGDAVLDASEAFGDTRSVRIVAELDGLPVYSWNNQLNVGPDGTLTGGTGSLIEPAAGDEYPLIDADEALKLMNDGATEPPEDALIVEVAGAELGLSMQYSEGEPVLVPSWLFEVEDFTEDSVLEGSPGWYRHVYPAVDPGLLEFPDDVNLSGVETDGDADADADDSVSNRGGTEKPETGPAEPVEKDLTEGDGGSTGASDEGEPQPDLNSGEGVLRYDAGDRTLTYQFWGGVCGEYTVLAKETDTTVTLRVKHTPGDEEMCILIAEQMTGEVTLDAPVGGRTLLDEHGEEIPVIGKAGD